MGTNTDTHTHSHYRKEEGKKTKNGPREGALRHSNLVTQQRAGLLQVPQLVSS